eukprot:4768077-Alexandrium_andersonii.AAC.1
MDGIGERRTPRHVGAGQPGGVLHAVPMAPRFATDGASTVRRRFQALDKDAAQFGPAPAAA